MKSLRVCLVQPSLDGASETFLRAHARLLPADVTVVHSTNDRLPAINHDPILSQAIGSRMLRKTQRLVSGRPWDWEITSGYVGRDPPRGS